MCADRTIMSIKKHCSSTYTLHFTSRSRNGGRRNKKRNSKCCFWVFPSKSVKLSEDKAGVLVESLQAQGSGSAEQEKNH